MSLRRSFTSAAVTITTEARESWRRLGEGGGGGRGNDPVGVGARARRPGENNQRGSAEPRYMQTRRREGATQVTAAAVPAGGDRACS